MQQQKQPLFKTKVVLITLLSVLAAACFIFGAFGFFKAEADNITSANGSYKLVAHYEFNDPNNPGKDSSGYGFNLTNSGATYNSEMNAIDFGTDGFLYAPALNSSNQDFSDLIVGSYSLSFRIYTTGNNGGTHYIMSTNGWNGGGGLLWNWGGIKGVFSGDDSVSYSGDGTFSATLAWYRMHVIYDSTENTWTVKSTRENDGSYNFSVTKQNVPSHNLGGDANYTFTLGAQATYLGKDMDGHISADGYQTPLISDFRVYSGAIDQKEMDNIANKDSGKLVMDQQVFGDHMILQRNKNVEIYGEATPNKTVTVNFNGQTKTCTADTSGEFSVYLDPMSANATGQTLTVSCDGATKTFSDVLIGEVFLGIGQSNMAYPMFEFTYAEQEIKANNWSALENITTSYEYTKYNANTTIKEQLLPYKNNAQYLRFYMQGTRVGESRITWNTWLCPTTADFENLDGAYNALNMVSFTAVCYATQLQAKLGCPVGVVVNGYGGSRVRQWLSPEAAQVGMPGVSDSAIGTLYQSMTKPMGRFTYAGILWYQGESDIYDVSESANWVNACLALFNEYRNQQNDENLPVIVYQLPQFYGHNPDCYWQVMRELQAELAEKDDNIHVVCGIDTGDYCNIHPTDKMQLNERAVALAMEYIYGKTYSEVYGDANGTWGKAPEIVSAVRKNGYVTLTFKNAVYLSIKQNPDNNYKDNDGNNIPLYLTKTPITFGNDSKKTSTETLSESFGSYWLVGDNQIGFACDDASVKYVSYAINNVYNDNDRFIYNTYYKVGDSADAIGGVPVMPFTNVEIIDYAEYSSTLTINDSSMGSVTGYATGKYENGTSLNIAITAKEGYKIQSVKWNGEPENITNQSSLTLNKTVSGATSLEVTFAKKKYDVTINVTGGTADKTTVKVDHNGTATFTVTPNSGYEFSSVSNNATYNNGTVTVSNVTSATTVNVVFKIQQYTVTINVTGGTADKTSATVDHNGTATFTVTANNGYEFSTISSNATYNNGTVTVSNVTSDITVTVTFVQSTVTPEPVATHTVTINVTGGTADKASATVDHNGTATFTVTPNSGYEFSTISSNAIYNSGTVTVSNVTSDTTVTVTFVQSSVTPEPVATHTVTINVIGGTADKTTVTVNNNETATFTVTPSSGYEFSTISSNATYNNGTVTVSNVTSNLTVTVTFVVKTYTVSINVIGGTANQTTATVNHNGTATFTVSANEGYEFSTISSNATYNNGTVTVSNVTAATEVTVIFAIKTYNVSINVIGGSADKASATVNHNGTATFTVSANDGYEFSSVSSNAIYSEGTVTVSNVTENTTITVTFGQSSGTVNPEPTDPETHTVTIMVINGIANKTSATVEDNGTATFTVTANSGYEFSSVSSNATYNNGTVTVPNVTADTTVTVTFVVKTYTVSINVVGGTANKSFVTVTHNGTAMFTVTANSGYEFSSVSNNATYNNGTVTVLNVTSDTTVTVTFVQSTVTPEPIATHTVTINVIGGTADKTTVTVNNNETATFTVIPNNGYEFSSVSNNATYNNGTVTVSNVTSDITVTVTFVQSTVTPEPSVKYKVTLEYDKTQGSITGIKEEEYAANTSKSVKVTAKDGYEIKSITVNGKEQKVTDATKTSFTLNIDKDITIKVTFEATSEGDGFACVSNVETITPIGIGMIIFAVTMLTMKKKKED